MSTNFSQHTSPPQVRSSFDTSWTKTTQNTPALAWSHTFNEKKERKERNHNKKLSAKKGTPLMHLIYILYLRETLLGGKQIKQNS